MKHLNRSNIRCKNNESRAGRNKVFRTMLTYTNMSDIFLSEFKK